MTLKEAVEDTSVIRKICTILTPQEFTRVDGIIDLVFSTAEDVSLSTTDIVVAGNGKAPAMDQLDLGIDTSLVDNGSVASGEDSTIAKRLQVIFHEQCVAKVSAHLQANLVKVSRSTYRSPDGNLALSCTVSREYSKQNRIWYWFAFHPHQQEQLQTAPKAFAAFGCGSDKTIFLFPLQDLAGWLPGLNQTLSKKRQYWHVHIAQDKGRWTLLRRGGFENIDITKYLI